MLDATFLALSKEHGEAGVGLSCLDGGNYKSWMIYNASTASKLAFAYDTNANIANGDFPSTTLATLAPGEFVVGDHSANSGVAMTLEAMGGTDTTIELNLLEYSGSGTNYGFCVRYLGTGNEVNMGTYEADSFTSAIEWARAGTDVTMKGDVYVTDTLGVGNTSPSANAYAEFGDGSGDNKGGPHAAVHGRQRAHGRGRDDVLQLDRRRIPRVRRRVEVAAVQ